MEHHATSETVSEGFVLKVNASKSAAMECWAVMSRRTRVEYAEEMARIATQSLVFWTIM